MNVEGKRIKGFVRPGYLMMNSGDDTTENDQPDVH